MRETVPVERRCVKTPMSLKYALVDVVTFLVIRTRLLTNGENMCGGFDGLQPYGHSFHQTVPLRRILIIICPPVSAPTVKLLVAM